MALVIWLGYTKICKLHGTISFSAEASGAGNLQLWRHTKQEEYVIKACKSAEGGQPCDQFVIGCETSIKVTNDAIKLSDLETILGSKGQAVHLQDADPDELQHFIDKLPHSMKVEDLRGTIAQTSLPGRNRQNENLLRPSKQQHEENVQWNSREMQQPEENSKNRQLRMQERYGNLQRQSREIQPKEENLQWQSRLMQQLREIQQREEDSQRQIREMQLTEENLQRQLREIQQREQNSRRQLASMQQRKKNYKKQLRDVQQREENCQRRLREMQENEENWKREFSEIQQREENSQRQLREIKQREENSQRQLREMQQREENSQRQLREMQQREENSQRQLREMQQREENSQRQLREIQQREEDSQRQLREMQQREEDSQRQLREMQQREEDSQRQLREMHQRHDNLQRQLSEKEQQLTEYQNQVMELRSSLSTARQSMQALRRQGKCDWVIFRNEIQIADKCLGRGGWGFVLEGTYCGCPVAVKQIHDLILSPHNLRLFEREMNIASKCRHPNLLQFIGATNDEESPLFVTELMEISLRALLEQRKISEIELAVISLDVARAINYLHKKQPEAIIHRDVSSANVLLRRHGDRWRGKVSDYGTANFKQQTMIVAPGAQIYCAPEALTSNQTVKVDVYSFGVLLCEMYIRELPDPESREEQVVLVTNDVLRGLVRRCLQRNPDRRPTMQEIIDELEKFIKTFT